MESSFEKQVSFKLSLTLSVGLRPDISSSGRYSVDQFYSLLCNLLAHLLSKGICNRKSLVGIHVLTGRFNSMILNWVSFLLTSKLEREFNVKSVRGKKRLLKSVMLALKRHGNKQTRRKT